MTHALSGDLSALQLNSSARRLTCSLGELTEKNTRQLNAVLVAAEGASQTDAALLELARTAPDLVRLAYHGELLVAALILRNERLDDSRWVAIHSIAVLPKYRRHAFGSKLLEYAVTYSKTKASVTKLVVDVPRSNAASVAFVEKNGFVKRQDALEGHTSNSAYSDADVWEKEL
eukprot:TRINITY_DN10706_c0_g1_i1.p1 TRINITY_DN10706_c0_g1~~TRINITY_DN10706_c0_g1_i1.p1  ORF type:complete len:174 (+),score=39.42 TRINITY_DN10706_c0_g1_i1:55-576(+)